MLSVSLVLVTHSTLTIYRRIGGLRSSCCARPRCPAPSIVRQPLCLMLRASCLRAAARPSAPSTSTAIVCRATAAGVITPTWSPTAPRSQLGDDGEEEAARSADLHAAEAEAAAAAGGEAHGHQGTQARDAAGEGFLSSSWHSRGMRWCRQLFKPVHAHASNEFPPLCVCRVAV